MKPQGKGMIRGAMAQEEPAMQEEPQQEAAAEKPAQSKRPQGNGARVLQAAMTVLYSKATRGGVARMLKGKDPVASLAQAVLFVLKVLHDEARKGGSGIPPDLLLAAIPELVKRLAEMAEAAGVQLTPEQVQQVEAVVTQRMQQRLSGQPVNKPQPAQPPLNTTQQTQPAQPQQGGMISQAMGA